MNKQQNKQKLWTTHIYINISCKCDTNRAGHFTLDAYASRPVACHCDLMRLAFEFAQRSRNLFRLGGNRRDRLYQQPGTIFFCCDSKKYTYGIITFSLHPPHCLGINSLIIFLKLFLQRGKTYYSEICGISRLGQVVLDPFTVLLHNPNDKNLPAVRAVQGDCQLPVKTMGIPTRRESPQSIATDVIPTYN